jgi:CopG family nickel-responsive transcriptional regulator
MSLIRFGVSLDEVLLEKFDGHIRKKQYSNRSEAIRDLIREALVREQWQTNQQVAGTLSLVYDHHKRELVSKLLDIQHDFHDCIISSQHVHIDHDNCLEVIVFIGEPLRAELLFNKLKSSKGVKHADISITTTGKSLK